jgi:hypothetical protein
VGIFHHELWWRIPVFCKLSARKRDTHAKALYVTQIFHSLGQIGIPIICDTWLSKVLSIDLSKRAPRILYLNAVCKPRHPHRGVCAVVRTVHHSISRQLLEGNHRIIWMPKLDGLGRRV